MLTLNDIDELNTAYQPILGYLIQFPEACRKYAIGVGTVAEFTDDDELKDIEQDYLGLSERFETLQEEAECSDRGVANVFVGMDNVYPSDAHDYINYVLVPLREIIDEENEYGRKAYGYERAGLVGDGSYNWQTQTMLDELNALTNLFIDAEKALAECEEISDRLMEKRYEE